MLESDSRIDLIPFYVILKIQDSFFEEFQLRSGYFEELIFFSSSQEELSHC
jgi:hypothetical protein